MFIKSITSSTPDIFSSFIQNMDGARLNKFNDKEAWHNVFRENITWQIEEKDFEVLFSKAMGRPNSPIRVLVGMMILKEGFGWSDEQLFEQCQFNILVMSSLGLSNINDNVPSPATYYNLKKALYEYQLKTGKDIIGDLFQKLTKKQAEKYGVNGTYIRMDSVLMGSNIAKCSRLQLIISMLQEFYKDIKKPRLLDRIDNQDRDLIEEMCKQKPGQITYKLSSKEREELIEQLGYLLFKIVKGYNDSDSEKYHLITRVLAEQYHIKGEKIELKELKEISAKSIQSPYDEDAEYRNKHGEKIRGYSANITETSNDSGLNLITDTIVEGATTADNEYVMPAIVNSKQIIESINHMNTDGAFNSPENQDFAKEENIEWILSGLQGREGAFKFNIENGQVTEITNKLTGEVFIPIITKTGKYKIVINRQNRYFSPEDVQSYFHRIEVNLTDQNKKQRRNNVEATIFQLVWPLRNKKTRYRGKFKNQLWSFLRSIWINLIRIKNYLIELCPPNNKSKYRAGLSTFCSVLSTILLLLYKINPKSRDGLQNIVIFRFVKVIA